VDTFESLLRQIVREEVRAALADLGTEALVPSPSGGEFQNPLALTTEEVAKKTGVAVQTLYNWRSQSLRGNPFGPRSFKLGHCVRYSEADVNEWLDELRSVRTGGTPKLTP
jgi:predicted DNA-binding transcriptional regulator AlpA